MVHQHFLLVPTLTVAENVILGDRRLFRLRLPVKSLARQVRQLAERYALPLDPDAVVGTLDIGAQQRVEIVKALYRDARILILDEPTAVLSAAEADRLFETVRTLAGRGASVILISHKLDDIFAVCGRVAVMRGGRAVAEREIGNVARDDLVRLMVGEDIAMPGRPSPAAGGRPVLSVRGLYRPRARRQACRGSRELRAARGRDPRPRRGRWQRPERARRVAHRTLSRGGGPDPDRRRDAGRAHERPAQAARRHAPCAGGPARPWHPSRPVARTQLPPVAFLRPDVQPLGRAAPRPRAPHARRPDCRVRRSRSGTRIRIDALSGGNQQKLVLARELALSPRILVAAHPTRGLDVRTIAFVRAALLEQRRAGTGILLVSSDLSEIWELSDRIMVIAGGRIRGPVALEQADLQQVGAWMAGR